MAKYSFEFKKKVVNDYISGKGSYEHLAKVNGISDKSVVRKWVRKYKKYGDAGLMRSRKNNVYSFEKKRFVVELYLTSKLSYLELAVQEGIASSGLIAQWVSRFRADGLEGLRPRKKGRKSKLKKNKKLPSMLTSSNNDVDSNAEYVNELEDELYRLRLENAFLKGLRRLRLEDEAKTRDVLDLFAVSEDSSN